MIDRGGKDVVATLQGGLLFCIFEHIYIFLSIMRFQFQS